MISKTISELNSATLADELVLPVEGVAATEKTTVGELKNYVAGNKQDKLIAGQNIVIDGNIISATATPITVDSELSPISENPVQNKVINAALDTKTNDADLATVAKSGSYDDLSNKPVIPSMPTVDQVYNSASTNAQSGVAIAGAGFLTEHQDISGKANISDLATVATSGSYNDLTNKPSIPAAQVQSDWNAVTGMGVILNKPVIPAAPVQADWNQTDTLSLDYIKNKPIIPDAVIIDQSYDGTSTHAQSGTAVSEAIAGAISSTYKPAGSVTFANLGALTAANEGKVYNVSEAFTTTIDFVDGLGGNYPAGTNVVIINVGTTQNPEYKYDILSGFVDLSGYARSADLATVATTGSYTDLSNTPSLANVATTGNYNDLSNKPTIPAEVTETTVINWGFTKNEGTVTSVNNTQPDVNGNVTLVIPDNQVQADWTESDPTSKAYILNKPVIPTIPTVDQVYNSTSTNAQSGVAIAGAGFLTEHQDISGKQDVANLVTSLSASSTDIQYPSAKCVYDLVGDIEAALAAI